MVDRSVTVRLRADTAQYKAALAGAAAETSAFGKNVEGSGKEIDKLSGRLRLMTDLATIGAPALTGFGAAGVGAMVSMAAEAGALAGALGVTVLAFHGMGDAMKALDKYQMQPTTENLIKLQASMQGLGSSGAEFVRFLDTLEPELKSLQFAARDGMFPGLEKGIQSLLTDLPRVRDLVFNIGRELGKEAKSAGKSLAGDDFENFLHYLETDGVPILHDTAHTIGNLAVAGANLMAAFGSTQTSFSGGLLALSQKLAEASKNLDKSSGFQEFLAYINDVGPKAVDALASIANAALQIVEATAPLGGPVLTILGKFADIIAAIAGSDLGTPIFAGLAALALYNRALMATAALNKTAWGGAAIGSMKAFRAELGAVITSQDRARMSATELEAAYARQNAALRGGFATMGKGAAVAAGLALATSGLADKTGLSNTASMALMGTIGGPWGAAIGAGIGAAQDFAAANDDLEASLNAMNGAANSGDLTAFANSISDAQSKLNEFTSSPSWTDALTGFGLIGFAKNKNSFAAMWSNLTGGSDDAQKKIDEARQKLDGLRDGSIKTFNPVQALSGAMQASAQAAMDEAKALKDATDAMREKRQEALRGVNAHLDYEQAIDDATKALKDNGKTVDDSTDKGRNNLRALYAIAAGWNSQSNAAKNAKGSLEDARKNFITTAEAMGMAAGKAKDLADKLFEIPPKRTTQIGLDGIDNAINKAQGLKAILDQLHSKDINIALHYQTLGNRPGAPLPGASGNADGGTIGGQRHPYGDKMLYLLAPGEEVISNRYGQADRHRSTLKAINAGRMADGGTSGHGSRPFTLFTSQAGADIVDSAHGIAQALKLLQAALDKSTKALDKERQTRDDLQSQYDQIKSSVGSAYSTMDPFAASSGSSWAASNPLAMFDSAVAGNTANTEAAQKALAFAASHGLDGPLYAALAASGNLPLLQAFANLSASEIDKREQAFAAQSNAQSALGGMAANAEVGAQLADANKHLDKLQAEVRGLRHDVKQADQNNQKSHKQNSKDVTDGVNGAASNGHRRGRR